MSDFGMLVRSPSGVARNTHAQFGALAWTKLHRTFCGYAAVLCRYVAAFSSTPTLFLSSPRSFMYTPKPHPRIPYLLLTARWTAMASDLSRTLATASIESLFGLPRGSQIASVTRGVLRIRRTFHESSSVTTKRRSPSGAAQIAVGYGLPSLVNVVSRM